MKIKAVLFDLDGTLLPMDQDEFLRGYFSLLAKKAAKRGYDAKELYDAIWQGTFEMIKNDGKRTGEEVFWVTYKRIFGERAESDKPMFEEFYAKDFDGAKGFCSFNPEAAKCVREIKKMGYRAALATNPVFPRIATEKRIRWAGLEPSDFEIYTTYETVGFCKPNPKYYEWVAGALGLSPEECLMVGNDTGEDMVAKNTGMKVFLLTDCLINKTDSPENYPHGSFPELMKFISELS